VNANWRGFVGLLDSVAKKATKELEKQVKDKGGKEIEKRAKKEMKKRFKI
jgi:poly-D-alanine transfer protein DltD